jgi:hypothetical protein
VVLVTGHVAALVPVDTAQGPINILVAVTIPPTYTLPPTPTPPATCSAPVLVDTDAVVAEITICPAGLLINDS